MAPMPQFLLPLGTRGAQQLSALQPVLQVGLDRAVPAAQAARIGKLARLHGVAAVGALVFSNGRSEHGREVKLDESSYNSRAGRLETRMYQPRFTPVPEVQRVSLDILISRGRQFEFLIAQRSVGCGTEGQMNCRFAISNFQFNRQSKI
jgi:hypothetical protein